MNTKNNKSLEETIKELNKRYKNVPSPLSEGYNKMNSNIHFTPVQKDNNFTNKLLDGFKPRSYKFGDPL